MAVFTDLLPAYFTEEHFENLYRRKQAPGIMNTLALREKNTSNSPGDTGESGNYLGNRMWRGVLPAFSKKEKESGVDISSTALSRAKKG